MEEELKKHFKEKIYYPLLRDLTLPKNKISNAGFDPLLNALFRGQITYNEGTFSGKLNAGISKALKELGAKFDRKEGTFHIPYQSLPIEVKNMISSSEGKFKQKLQKMDRTLSQILPEEVAGSFKSEHFFDKTIWKADTEFRENVKKIAVPPQLTDDQRKVISKEWQNNMDLWIQKWTEDEIKGLRKKVQESTFAGNRYGSLTKMIQDSYQVSANKAKFLARQETNLLLSKFKETRYEAAGFKEYIWRCVKRPHDKDPNHHTPGNVRYAHGLLEGKVFSFDNPPVTSNPGQTTRRNNPGADYNCRCFSRPI